MRNFVEICEWYSDTFDVDIDDVDADEALEAYRDDLQEQADNFRADCEMGR